MEEIIKTITTERGGRVSLIKPLAGLPFFRYEAGANALTDTFKYIIRQNGQQDTATVTVNVEVPVEKDTPQDHFHKQMNKTFGCLEKLMDGSAATMALTNMMGIDEGETLNDDWLDQIFTHFNFFDYAMDEGNEFVFKNHIGKYVYNEVGYWEMHQGSDTIEIVFPSSPLVYENDTVVRVSNFKTQRVKTEDGTYHIPTDLEIDLSINRERYFAVTMGGEKAEIPTEIQEETGFPVAFDIQLSAAPYTLRATMKHKDYTRFFPTLSLKSEGGCSFGAETTLQLANKLSPQIELEKSIMEDGKIYINDLTITGLETLWTAAIAQVETQEEIDKMLDLKCLYDGDTIGKFRFVVADETVVIEYPDGTSEDIVDMVTKFMEEYFNNTKPDGTARNDSFNFKKNENNYRSHARPAASMADSMSKASAKVNDGFSKRVSRAGVSAEKVADNVKKFLLVEKHQTQGDDYYPYYDEEMQRYEEEAARRAKEEAEARALKEEQDKAEAKAKAAADAKAKQLADAKAKADADAKAKQLADAKAKAAAEAKAKKAADAKAKAAADARAKSTAAAKAKQLADANAKTAADAKAKQLADAKARTAADAKAKQLEEAKAKKAADARASSAADAKAKTAADAKAGKAAGTKAKADASAKASASKFTAKSATDANKKSGK